MKDGWDAVFKRKSLDKPVPIETHPYVRVKCNTDTARFANAGSYAHHMTTHKFHRGHNNDAISMYDYTFSESR